jgi:hypothetical protein
MWLSFIGAVCARGGVTDSSARSRKWVRHTAVLIPRDGCFNTVVGWDGSRKERDLRAWDGIGIGRTARS